jgi:hypothetical protein
MPSIETACVFLGFAAVALSIGAVLLRTACSLANSFNRVTTGGAPIPAMSHWDAAANVFLAGMLAALSLIGMQKLGTRLAADESPLIVSFLVEVVPAGLFILAVAFQLPTGSRTTKALKVLAATVLLGLIYGGVILAKRYFGLTW